ncbi:MAG: response regulator [Melioribacteraceae bacterium]|nr:response regulator [Melioribacteraceae bacterium]
MHSILIVDDDLNLCSALKEELIELGFDTEYVNSADKAIEILEQRSFDLILLDLKMPEKDGFYVLKTMKEKDINTKVIVLTAYADVQSAIDSAKLGANDFISKPYDLDELIITVRKVLQLEDNEN